MGTTLSVTTGFGFAVPPEVVERWNEPHADDEEWQGFGEYLWELVDDEPLLDERAAWWYDYTPEEDGREARVVFLESTMRTEYGAGVFRARNYDDGLPNADEFNALHRVAQELGIKNVEFEYLTVVSLG